MTNGALQAFLQRLIQTKSFSGEEGPLAGIIQKEMQLLGYQNIQIDPMGNVIGQIGDGPKAILFDGHMDTVRAEDSAAWKMSPFSGTIAAGIIYGRGSVDMKSGLAAAIYAAARAGKICGKTVYVSATVDEEFCDGAALGYVLDNLPHRPEAVVICEPSDNCIVQYQRGKALVEVEAYGKAAHGATPELGRNAIYEMSALLPKIQVLGDRLAALSSSGSLTLSQITSRSNSLNAVPDRCSVCIDRRLAMGESRNTVTKEFDDIIAGHTARWKILGIERTSWTGHPITYYPLHDPWELDLTSPLGMLALEAWHAAVSDLPHFANWSFSTNAVAAVERRIPVLGFGPGAPADAHTADESCPLYQVFQAADYYKALISIL